MGWLTLGRVAALVLLAPVVTCAQGVIVTVAGNDRTFPRAGPGLSAPLDKLWCATGDAAGNVYVCDSANHIVVKYSPLDGTATVVAGNGIRQGSFSGDGGPAAAASLNQPMGLAVDAAGNLYIADALNRRIRKVEGRTGIITSVAGTGGCCFSGDGGPATAARLDFPIGAAVTSSGILYFADCSQNRLRKVDLQGIITTVAGTGVRATTGDGGQAASAALNCPSGVALDSAGNLYISESGGNRIRKIRPDGVIITVAGNGQSGYSGDGVQATNTSLSTPEGVAVDLNGNIFIPDRGNGRIRKVAPSGIITTVAGGGGSLGDGGPATSAGVNDPWDVVVDAAGNLYIADAGNRRLRRVSAGGTITTVAGTGQPLFSGDGGAATLAQFDAPRGVAADTAGNLYIADQSNHRIRKVTPQGMVSTMAGNGQAGVSGDGGPATSAAVGDPHGVAIGPDGSIYIAQAYSSRVRKVSPLGTITTLAGGGNALGDNGPATSAKLAYPANLAVDAASNVFISDYKDHRVRKVSPAGTITTVAGTGQAGFSGDGGQATAAMLNGPSGVTVDPAGYLYINEFDGNRIRKVILQSGIISTVAGTGQGGFSGDGGPATSAVFGHLEGMALDAAGNIYVTDRPNQRIRKITPQGVINTVAGSNRAGFSGDGGLGTGASLNEPIGVGADAAGNLYIADSKNNRIRALLNRPSTFTVSATSLSFSAPAGSAPTVAQQVKLSSDFQGLLWETSNVIPITGGVAWLKVSPNFGALPATLSVSADATNLNPGAYQGSIVISAAGTTSTATIAVTFTVSAALSPALSVEPASLSFQTLAGGTAPPAQLLRIQNSGSGTLSWTVQASARGGSWLAASPLAGSASPALPGTVEVRVNPTGLPAGSYSGSLSVQSTTTNQTVSVPVNLLVQQSTGVLLLSQSHLLFRAVQNGGAEPAQTFGVLNVGGGALDWTAQSTQPWLLVSPASGRSDAGAVQIPLVSVSVDPTGLQAGFYVGLVRVAAGAANNSPRVLRVDLHVLAPGSRLGAVVRPTGLIFVATVGGPSPGSQEVTVATTESVPVEFVSQSIDGPWVTRSPELATASRGNPGRILVQPDLGTLGAGVQRAGLTVFTRNDGEQYPVRLLLLVLPQAAATTMQFSGRGPLLPDCTPSELHLQFSSLFNNFSATVGWPTTVLVNARDNCGNAAVGGTVTLSFSSGEPALVLTDLKNGQYQGNWRPNSSSAQVVVTARGSYQGLQGQATATAQVGLNPNPQGAILAQGGVLLGAGFDRGPVAPGSIISLFGQKLAASELLASTLPLPTSLNGVRVLVGGVAAPLFYVGPGQVNAQVPVELAGDRQLQVVVETSGVSSAPEPLQTAGNRPGIFTLGGTFGNQGAILIANTNRLAMPVTANVPSEPAVVGGFISIYCTGLGPTDPAVGSGEPGPATSTVKTSVTVTIGGQNATVTFAGLAPGFAGVYQVNAQVPAGVTTGNAVPVVLTQGSFQSNTATIAVR